ncbi:alpha-xenorhabdolysin family binary toxin subunit B [Pseudomonas shirazensis]|uniref:alpha-xenorhabdolysin family binary toxin subunit B n=1 Tax=Pseudomonas shirazensis TaxID=2745494 RepID=UPI003D290CF0
MERQQDVMQYPSVRTQRALQGDISRLVHGQMSALPAVVRENAGDLLRLIRECDGLMGDSVLNASIMLTHQNWLEIQAVAGPQAAAHTADLRKDIEEDMLRLRGRLTSLCQAIGSKVQTVRSFPLSDLSERLLSLNATRLTVATDVERIEQTLQQLQATRQDLDVIIKTFEAPSLLSVIKGMIPTESEVDLMFSVVKKPTVSKELVTAALNKFEANIDVIGEGRRFSDLVASRERLVGRIREQQTALAALQSVLQPTEQELAQIPHMATVGALRDSWVAEADKLVSCWQTGQDTANAATELADLASALKALAGYLGGVRNCYEAG